MLEFLEYNIYFCWFIVLFAILVLIISIINCIDYNKLMTDNTTTKIISKNYATAMFSFSIILVFLSLVVIIWSGFILSTTYPILTTQNNVSKITPNNVSLESTYPNNDNGKVVTINPLSNTNTIYE